MVEEDYGELAGLTVSEMNVEDIKCTMCVGNICLTIFGRGGKKRWQDACSGD